MDILQSAITVLTIPTKTYAAANVVFKDPTNAGATVDAISPSGAVTANVGVVTNNVPAAGSSGCSMGAGVFNMAGQWSLVLRDGGGIFIDVQQYNGLVQAPAAGSIFCDSAGTFTNLLAIGNPTAGIITVQTTALITAVLGPYACYAVDAVGGIVGKVEGQIVSSLGGGLDAAQTRTAIGLANPDLDTQIGSVLTAIATRAAPGDQMTLTAGERTAISNALLDLASGIETGLTPRQLFRALGAALGGVVIQTAPGVWQFRGAGVATARITASIPGDGSRPSMVLSL